MGSSTVPEFELVDDKFMAIDVGRRSAPRLYDLDGVGDLDPASHTPLTLPMTYPVERPGASTS